MKNNRARLAIVVLAVVDLGLFMLSGIPRYRDATHGADMIVSDVFWFGFLIGALALIVTGVTVLVRRIRGARTAPAQR